MIDDPSDPDSDFLLARPDSAGIYGLIVTATVLATAGDSLRTAALAVAVVGTLLVYWLAEQYAEYYAHISDGHAPSAARTMHQLRSRWQLITASFIPLLAVLLARLLGASHFASAVFGLLVIVALLMFYGWRAGRTAGLHGLGQALMTLAAGSLGLIMILLKISLQLVH